MGAQQIIDTIVTVTVIAVITTNVINSVGIVAADVNVAAVSCSCKSGTI